MRKVLLAALLLAVYIAACIEGRSIRRHRQHEIEKDRQHEIKRQMRAYLRHYVGHLEFYGYLRPFMKRGRRRYKRKQIRRALRRYQRQAAIRITGNLDEDTLMKMQEPRCGFRDVEDEEHEVKRFVPFGSKWNTHTLRWKFENNSPDLTVSSQREALNDAFERWTDESDLTITETTGYAEILVKFVTGDHGDGSSFDGRGGVLAHAFFPYGAEIGISGDMHFDDDETFDRSGSNGKTSLDYVATHEAGHALGLKHSADTAAIMYPWYRTGSPRLTRDDINGIKSLYPESK